MRLIAIAAALTLIAALAGCNRHHHTQARNQPCNCQTRTPLAVAPAAPAAPKVAAKTHHHHRRQAAKAHMRHHGRHYARAFIRHRVTHHRYARVWRGNRYAYGWHNRYAHPWHGNRAESGNGYAHRYYVPPRARMAENRPAPLQSWTDGYGRVHYYAAESGTARLTRADERKRLDPWHGYDVDCPEK